MSDLISRIERELAAPDPTEAPPPPPPRIPRLALAVAAVVLTPFFLAEILLRAVWAPPPRVPSAARSATAAEATDSLNRRFGLDLFEADPRLLWRLRPGVNLGGLEVSPRGLLGAGTHPFPPNRRKALRVLVLGDSVPALTYRPFPVLIQRLTRSVPGVPEILVVNGAVPGYSTEQGRVRLEQLQDLHPDVVVLCFGHADRSAALNLPDRYLLAGTAPLADLARKLFGAFRLVHWLTAPAPDRWSRFAPLPSPTPRVSPERFEQNLLALTDMIRRMEAVPVLATQPGPGAPRAGLPAASEAGLPDQDLYNAIIRRTAERSGSALLDLDEEFIRRDRERLLEPDGIHLTPPGHNLTARLMIALLRDRGLVEPEAVKAIAAAARYDTAAPDRLAVEWNLFPSDSVEASAGTSVSVSVLARNAGNTRWLRDHIVEEYGDRRDFDYGGLALVARWRTRGAGDTTAPAALARLTQDVPPGESTSVTLTLAPPLSPGVHAAEIGWTTEGYGDLSRLGAETTTLTVVWRGPPGL